MIDWSDGSIKIFSGKSLQGCDGDSFKKKDLHHFRTKDLFYM